MNKRIKDWNQFLNENIEIVLYESSLSRIWQFIENNYNFGVISPFRKNYSIDENLERYKELKHIIRNKLKLGYIEMEGGFFEEGDWIKEKSLFIPNIKKVDLINLGKSYDQYSVIYKDENEFIEIGTNDMSGIGNIIIDFIKEGWDKNLQINSDLTKMFFSKLAKGSHRNKKFLFNVDETYLLEVDENSFNEKYRENNKGIKQKRLIKLL